MVETVKSVLASSEPAFEVIVIDQSDGKVTQSALARYIERGEVRYVPSSTRGVSAGRNVGIGVARSDLIGLTDDDCNVSDKWIGGLIAAFAADDRIGVAYGNVFAVDHDKTKGFIPAYRRSEPYLATALADKHRAEGIGACMGLRKKTWETLCGFDEVLGTGAPFFSAEDLDLAMRALEAGFLIYETPEMAVLHRGFRPWEAGHDLLRAHLYGMGGAFAKHIKCGRWAVTPYLWRLGLRWLFGAPKVDFGRKPPRGLRLAAFLQGFLVGFRSPVDRARLHFAAPTS